MKNRKDQNMRYLTKDQRIRILNKIIDSELEKPENEVDMKLVDQCMDIISKLNEGKYTKSKKIGVWIMFYKLMYKRSVRKYRKSYINLLCIFIVSLSMLGFTNIYCDSYFNFDYAVTIPELTEDWTCDIRIKNISESEAALYRGIEGVDMKYIDGNLDFYLLDTDNFEAIHREIARIFNSVHSVSDDSGIWIYYGEDPIDHLDDHFQIEFGLRIVVGVFQIMLSAAAVVAMSSIYSGYIEQRTEEIRTLSAVGITSRQLRRLFLGEFNILYLISVVMGIPIGALAAYLFTLACKFLDMSGTNMVYLVFDLNILTLLITALLGYIAVYITFRIVLRKILKIDASYTCAETIIEFDPDKSRGLYDNCDRHFENFFAAVLRRRASSKSKMLTAMSSFSIALSIFMMNTTNYMICAGDAYGKKDAAVIAASISIASIFIMVTVYVVVYGLVVVYVFMKRQMEANAKTAQTLYSLGADESTVYSCFHIYTMRKIIVTELFGFGIGYAATILIFSGFSYGFNINLWYIMGNVVLAAAFYFVYMLSMKKHFNENCRSYGSDVAGG